MSGALRLLLLAPLLLFPVAASAADAFQVQSAFVSVHGGTYTLDARIVFPVNDEVRATLESGATIKLALQVVIDKQRRYWLDKEMVDDALRRELSWNAVSRRYILKYRDSGEQDTYEVSVRAEYRSTRLPDALRALAFWSDGWSRKTEWKSWILPR
jgi:Domain of unknown function (DUF4390)